MIDTNQVRRSLTDRKGLIRHRETIRTLCDEIDRLRAAGQKPQEDESELTSMCMTYRHDFGLLSEKDRESIINKMRPIYEHHVKPLLRPREVRTQGKTVRVAVKVAVDKNGDYYFDEDNFKYLMEPRAYYTLTADLPVPEEVEVKAEVEGE